MAQEGYSGGKSVGGHVRKDPGGRGENVFDFYSWMNFNFTTCYDYINEHKSPSNYGPLYHKKHT